MGCFIVPLSQAIVTSVARKVHKSDRNSDNAWFNQLPKLELMLWGGSAMLVIDHIINGEVTYTYPFLTALGQEGGDSVLLNEMLTVGVPMSLLVTLIYAVMVAVEKRRGKA